MRFITLTFLTISSFIGCFPNSSFARNELIMTKEVMYWATCSRNSDSPCSRRIKIEIGRDVSDMRDEPCGYSDGTFSLTLSGPPETTVIIFGDYNFKKENGYLIIKKTDDRVIWLLDLISFPANQWFSSEANENSGAFETFYSASPIFDQSVSSIKWVNIQPKDQLTKLLLTN
jgi:hypothetical protein